MDRKMAATMTTVAMARTKPSARSSISEVKTGELGSTKAVSWRITSGRALKTLRAMARAARPLARFREALWSCQSLVSFPAASTTQIRARSAMTQAIRVGKLTILRRLMTAVALSAANTMAARVPTPSPTRRQEDDKGLSRPSPTVSSTLRTMTRRAGPSVPGRTATNCSSILPAFHIHSAHGGEQHPPDHANRTKRHTGQSILAAPVCRLPLFG